MKIEFIRVVLSECSGVGTAEFTASTRLAVDLGLDDLELCSARVEIEKKFNVELSDEAWSHIHTIGDLEEFVMQHGSAT